MPWIITRKDGIRVVRWRENGRLRSRSSGSRLLRDAHRLLRLIEARLSAGTLSPDPPPPTSLPDIFTARLAFMNAMNYSPNTIRREALVHRHYLEHFSVPPTAADLERYTALRQQAGISPGGINIELRHLAASINWAASRKYCPPVKASFVRLTRKSDFNPFLEESEISRLFDTITSGPPPRIPYNIRTREEVYWRRYWLLVFRFFLDTGARRNEVVTLKWKDVDLPRSIVMFRKTKSRRSRMLHLNGELSDMLREHRRHNPDDDRVFHHQESGIYLAFKFYCRAAGILDPDKTRLHTLRHSFATHQALNGTDPMTLMHLMGHQRIETTLRYFHLPDKQKKLAANNLPWITSKK